LEVSPIESAAALLERHDVIDDDRWPGELVTHAKHAERMSSQHCLSRLAPPGRAVEPGLTVECPPSSAVVAVLISSMLVAVTRRREHRGAPRLPTRRGCGVWHSNSPGKKTAEGGLDRLKLGKETNSLGAISLIKVYPKNKEDVKVG